MTYGRKYLITDFDNTLFDWFDYWYQSFYGTLCYILEHSSGINREDFLLDIKKIHEQHNTTEYLNVFCDIAKLPKYRNILNFSDICQQATDLREKLKAKHLHLFDGVLETLKSLKQNSYKIILFTESEAYSTTSRVRALKLDGIIDYIYAPPAKNAGITLLNKTELISFDEQEHYKPSSKNIEKILSDLNIEKSNCYYVGDSLIKDIKMAQNAQITDIYAKYGENYKKMKEYELLKDVTFWNQSLVKAEAQSNENDIKPTFILENSFKEILDIVCLGEVTNA